MKILQPVLEDSHIYLGYDFEISPEPYTYMAVRPWMVMATLVSGVLSRLPGAAAAFSISGALSRAQYDGLDVFGDVMWDRPRSGQPIPAGDVILEDYSTVLVLPTSREALEGACNSLSLHGILVVRSLDDERVTWFKDAATREDVGRFIEDNILCHIWTGYGDSDQRDVDVHLLEFEYRDSILEGLITGVRAFNME